MLEVCFSDSAKGALLLAQHCGGDVIAASIGVITNARGLRAVWEKRKALREYKKRRAELKKLAVPLGGRREDVVSVSFGLSEGDIRSPITPGECPRKACVRDWLAFSRYGEKIDLEAEVDAFWDGCLADLRKLQARPDRVRIWLDATPDAQCGLLFLADLYREGGTKLHLVELPRQVRQPDGCLVEYRGWAEVEPERFGAFLSRERVLPSSEVRTMAGQWQTLQAENAPLRVVEQGRVVSAGLDYYDGLIRQAIPDAPCQAAQIIGTALGKQKVPTGDRFIAKRLQHFIDAGELAVVQPGDEGFYSMVVRRR